MSGSLCGEVEEIRETDALSANVIIETFPRISSHVTLGS